MDYMTVDIGASWQDSGGVFLEGNLTPGLDALIAWGYSSLEAARLVLGEGRGRVPTRLVVVPEAGLDDALNVVRALPIAASQGWASHRWAALGDCSLAIAEDHPWAGIRAVLRHRSAESLVAVIGSSGLQLSGMPLDRFDGIVLADPSLPGQWKKVLAEGSVEPLQMVQPDAVPSMLAQIAGKQIEAA